MAQSDPIMTRDMATQQHTVHSLKGRPSRGFGADLLTTVWRREVTSGFLVSACTRGCVGLYLNVGFFIVPEEYGLGKANLGLRAPGPCQTHQPVSCAIMCRTAVTYTHTCTNMKHAQPQLLRPYCSL